MKKLTAILFLAMAACVAIVITQCKNKPAGDVEKFSDTVITAVPLPDKVPGFTFPTDSNQIFSWINKPVIDSVSVFKHAWGIWAGLTANSGQTFQGDSLLVYQTWLGVSEIRNLIITGTSDAKSMTTKTSRVALDVPHQVIHAKNRGDEVDTSNKHVWTSVAYSPEAAAHAIKNSLFKLSVINKYQVKGGIGGIPPFPPRAMTIKPVYFVGSVKDSLIRVPAWHGPPAHAEGYGYSKWQSYIYVDVHNKQPANKKPVPVTTSNPSPAQIAAATVNKSDFIHFKLNAAMAAYMNQQQAIQLGTDSAHAGDIALLVAMHVTTKEVKKWTWQTYYWAPDPSNPDAPSTNVAASLRPAQITGAAAHYAMGAAYTEVAPNLESNDKLLVKPVFVYNPYLEAPFGAAVFAGIKNKLNDKFKYGVQTNCMSCHSLATIKASQPYTADQFIDMKSLKDTLFVNQVQLDFAWSIQTALINDTAGLVSKTLKK